MNDKIIIENRHDAKYDIVKLVLSVFVVAIHSALYTSVLYPWLRIAVPLFFIISSYFIFLKLNTSDKSQHKQIICKFVKRNVKLYFSWFVIFLPYTLYIRRSLYFQNSLFENIWNFIQSLLFGNTFIASWFIFALVIGFLIVYYMDKLLKNDYVLFVISLLAFVFVTLSSSYSSIISNTCIERIVIWWKTIFGSTECSFISAVFWVFVGKMFSKMKLRKKSNGLLLFFLICSCCALYYEWLFVVRLDGVYDNPSYFMLFPVCFLLFLLIQKIKPINYSKSVYLRHLSTIIYVTHGSIIPIVKILSMKLIGIDHALISFGCALCGCVCLHIFIEVVAKKCNASKIGKIFKILY